VAFTIHTPEGTRDRLFAESSRQRQVRAALTGLFEEKGYAQVSTPEVEYYDLFLQSGNPMPQESLVKVVDRSGKILVMRPDCTTPIARVAATKLRQFPLPQKLYYDQTVFRSRQGHKAHSGEIAQCGVELIGGLGQGADIEIIALAVEALRSCGLTSFHIELGHVGLFQGEEERAKAMAYLEELYGALTAGGYGDYVKLDLGLMHQIHYYTGVVFRGYAQGAGEAVLTGGRYDNLLSAFGRPAPATGFAVDADAVAACLAAGQASNSGKLRIALTKGRLLDRSIALFEKMGLDCGPLKNPGRRLIHAFPNYPMEAVLAKAPDVITYVTHGVCDLGIAGRDTILEQDGAFYEVLDLGFGKCRFALAVKEGTDFYGTYQTRRVATKYPQVARDFFEKKGMDVEIIKIEGSVELAPILGLADGIVDIVETGATLRENGLIPIEDVAVVSARLIVNTASMKLHQEAIDAFLDRCKRGLEE